MLFRDSTDAIMRAVPFLLRNAHGKRPEGERRRNCFMNSRCSLYRNAQCVARSDAERINIFCTCRARHLFFSIHVQLHSVIRRAVQQVIGFPVPNAPPPHSVSRMHLHLLVYASISIIILFHNHRALTAASPLWSVFVRLFFAILSFGGDKKGYTL